MGTVSEAVKRVKILEKTLGVAGQKSTILILQVVGEDVVESGEHWFIEPNGEKTELLLFAQLFSVTELGWKEAVNQLLTFCRKHNFVVVNVRDYIHREE